jgi:cytochrome c553
MKRTMSTILLLSLIGVSVSVFAGNPTNLGPEVIKLKMGDLVLPFKHWSHQKRLNNECFHCHATKIGKIEDWSKETAHNLCISCHEIEGKGPVECQQCHNDIYSKSDQLISPRRTQ